VSLRANRASSSAWAIHWSLPKIASHALGGSSDLADERQKTTALTHEREDALRIARGGSAWRRITRVAKWFLIGAAKAAH
jgi:hypothetical protein